ncbi:acyl-CoA dehydrogenase [Allosaccharopolyspora coralli]|uniref:Acyl-CoA dehydrogenase n=1 Tax=Allosaccharopolyspora coralli TaxID=2665642 RepID=A0A5Q3QA16_9PSEU|nr:acyl-CoA dehydrogenase family protein [Allosaccharopolyspora coralli]QGK71408.1 acyl-CoA dehydrogenase [Allosaccharopolyspora coralli]
MTEADRLHTSEDFDTILANLDEVLPTVGEDASLNEQRGDLAPRVVEALWSSGLFGVGVPRELGGLELCPRQVLEVVARLSYSDASTGWTFAALQMITGTTAAYLGPEAVRELFDTDSRRHALIAGQGTRMGRAVPVDGGYRVSGHWHFASGVSLATHVHSAALCEESGRAMVVTCPKDEVELIDNWDVLGLRATGSIDYTCSEVFVPETHVYDIATIGPRHGGAMYRLGLANMAGISHSGWALGVGRRLLDEMNGLAATKTGKPGATVDTSQFYAEYAQAESKLRAAHAWAREVWEDNEATLDGGVPLSTEQETFTRLMLNNTTWSVHEIGQTVHKWAATAAIRDGDLQRVLRDLYTGTQHITSSPAVLQNCGKWLAGLAPDTRWTFLDLEPVS